MSKYPQGFHPSNGFDPARGGHAPGYLRDAFCGWDRNQPDGPLVVHTEDGRSCPLRWLVGQLWNSTDVMPGEVCDDLDLPPGSTYAQGARHAAEAYL